MQPFLTANWRYLAMLNYVADWKIWEAETHELHADAAALYGDQFVETLNVEPRSVFIAEGSAIEVFAASR